MAKMSEFLRNIFLGILLTLIGSVGSIASAQSNILTLDGSFENKIIIGPGLVQTMRTDREFSEIVVGDSSIADVFPLTNSSFYIQGIEDGNTNVSFFGVNRKLLGVVDIVVATDFSHLEKLIKAALPTSDVTVESVNHRIQLTGEVTDSAHMATVSRLASEFSNSPAINAVRVRQPRQVELDVRIIELERTSGKTLGLELSEAGGTSIGSSLPFGSDPFGTFVGNLLVGSSTQIDVLINALEAQGVARRLANPKLVSTSGVEANFVAGGEIPITTAVAASNGGVTSGTGYRDYGVRLNFIPEVLENDLIGLRIRPEVSDVDTANSVNGNPAFTSRKADTTVILRDGQSYAIAGLLQANNERNIEQLPWLGDIPVIGTLFRSARFKKRESDLVIVVTPKLVEPFNFKENVRSPLEARRPSTEAELFLLGLVEADKAIIRGFTEGKGAAGSDFGHILKLK